MGFSKEVENTLRNANLTEEELEHIKAENLLRMIPKILELLSPDANNAEILILDVGCGDGTISYCLKSILGARTVGIDCDINFLRCALKKGIDVLMFDLERANFPFRDASFSYVICVEVIEHLFSPHHCLKEVARILKPGGELVISTPNLVGLKNRFLFLMGRDPVRIWKSDARPYDRHVRLYAVNSLTDLLKPLFDLIKLEYVNTPRTTFKGIIRDFLSFFRKNLGDTILLKCRRK